MAEDARKIKVTCGDVTLQLTLSTKLLAKPFEEAVLRPFLKAYAKKTGEPADLARVARVEVDEEMLGDHGIAASVVLLARELSDETNVAHCPCAGDSRRACGRR